MKNLLVMNGTIEEITKEGVVVLVEEVDKKLPLEIMEIKKSSIAKEDLNLIYEGLGITLSVIEEKVDGTIKVKFKTKFHYTKEDLELKKLKENV
jgi:hypothetical protein